MGDEARTADDSGGFMVCRRLVPMMLLLRMRMTADGGGCDESDDDVGVDGVCVDVFPSVPPPGCWLHACRVGGRTRSRKDSFLLSRPCFETRKIPHKEAVFHSSDSSAAFELSPRQRLRFLTVMV